MPVNLPFLPGYNVDTQPHSHKAYRKKQMFAVDNGIRVDKSRRVSSELSYDRDPLYIPELHQEAPPSKSSTDPSTVMSNLPSWVEYDRKVFRFFAYFKEEVESSAQERWRVRRCTIFYYLEDGSIHVTEPKVENSGIPQGVFVKRHRIPKPDRTYFTMKDLKVGEAITLYGREFFVTDCDKFTRDFYEEQGVPQGEPIETPEDPFAVAHAAGPETHHKQMNPLKQFMEASLGKPSGMGIQATQQFLKNDGKVLRFYCTWDDSKILGEKRPYVVHYFLADDTVEVLEIQQANSGRDPFPALLKRQKLPRDPRGNAPTIPRIGYHQENASDFIGPEDLKIGDIINVYGRPLFIRGCDTFTKQYYISKHGMAEEQFPDLQNDDTVEERPTMQPPPHNGFGSEEDSLGSFLYLMPKPPRRNFKKLMEHDRVRLRFLAQFLDPRNEGDNERRFIITYYAGDDSVGIFEKFQRNSGFIGGKFLERSRIKNPATQEYYKPVDFKVGSKLSVNKYSFKLIEADRYTENFIDTHPDMFPRAEAPAEAEAPTQESA